MNNSKTKWTDAISACVENGERILDDAKYLNDLERFPSAYVFGILAQEEFAKAYLLKLVDVGAIPMCDEVLRACRDHRCEHLIGLVMEHLFTPPEDYGSRNSRVRDGSDFHLPAHVADDLNIFCHEKLRTCHLERRNAGFISDQSYDKTAKRTADGALDKLKQNALYVGMGPNGVTSTPHCTSDDAGKAIETAEMLSDVARGGDVWAFDEKVIIQEGLKVILDQLRTDAIQASFS